MKKSKQQNLHASKVNEKSTAVTETLMKITVMVNQSYLRQHNV